MRMIKLCLQIRESQRLEMITNEVGQAIAHETDFKQFSNGWGE